MDSISNASDLKALEDASYGRYWQPVRDGEPVQLSFDLEFVLVAQPPFRGRQSTAATAGRQTASRSKVWRSACWLQLDEKPQLGPPPRNGPLPPRRVGVYPKSALLAAMRMGRDERSGLVVALELPDHLVQDGQKGFNVRSDEPTNLGVVRDEILKVVKV